MNREMLRQLQTRRKSVHRVADQGELPDSVRRYLPRNFSVREAGYPSAVEMLLQWEIRHRGCILAAREIFLDQPFPSSPEERITKWYICTALVEHAVQAFEDLQLILEWYSANWHQDEEALEVHIEETHARKKVTLRPAPEPGPGNGDDPAPFAGLP